VSARVAEWVARVAVRYRLPILAGTLLAVAVCAWPAFHVPFDASAEIWFLENDPALTSYARFHQIFGNDEFVVLATNADGNPDVAGHARARRAGLPHRGPEGTVFDNAILASLDRVTAMLDTTAHVGRVMSLANYETIEGEGDDVRLVPAVPHLPMTAGELASARERVLADGLARGRVVSADGKVATVVAEIDHRPGEFRYKADLVKTVNAFLVREQREHGITYAFTGSAVLDNDIYADTRHDLRWNVPLLYLFITLFLILTIRSVPGVLLPMGVILSAVILDRALIPALGWKENSLATIIPLVLTAVGVADSVHIVVQYLNLRGGGLDGPNAARETVRRLFKPCLLTSLTTAVGFLSLLTAPLAPLQEMGALTAIGVTIAFLLSVFSLPAALSYLEGDYAAYAVRRRNSRLMAAVDGLPALVRRRGTAILVVAGVVTVAAGVGIARLKVESNAIEFFRKSDPMRRVTEYIQDKIGGVGNLEVVVKTDGPGGIRDPEVLRAMDSLETHLRSIGIVTDAFSVVDYLKEINQAMHGGDPAWRVVPRSPDLVAQYLLLYGASSPREDLSNLVDLTQTTARVTARVKFASSTVYRRNVRELRAWLAGNFPAKADVELTGLMMLYKNMGDYIITSQIRSFLAALVVITLTMALAFRSWRLGLLSMIPNVWPIAFTLGFMGWVGLRLDMVNAMVAAVAIGIAVDDTIHFIAKYIEAVDDDKDLLQAVAYAFHVSGRAIVFTSIILFAGFAVILRSTFLPSVWFALLAAITIVMALLADLFILPAIFIRYRRVYVERRNRKRSAARVAALGAALALLTSAGPASRVEASAGAPEARGRAVMQAVEDANDDVGSELADVVMTLRDRGGNEAVRKARMAFLSRDDGDRSLIRFTDPPDLRGTAFLTVERPGDDDQWLYLPALGRVKRIAASRKTGNFAGTEFTYEDLGGRELDEYEHRWVRADTLDGDSVDVMEAAPLDRRSGYSRITTWVSRERHVILRAEYVDRKGALLKISRSREFTRPDGVHWRFRSAVMDNVRNGKSTTIRVERWTIGADLDPGLFTVEALEREW
jgi:predicted RND superfamily exporter protein/outer membrane lipoprotein-sorting protein